MNPGALNAFFLMGKSGGKLPLDSVIHHTALNVKIADQITNKNGKVEIN